MINFTKKESATIISNGAKLFEKNFLNKNFLIIYKDNANAYNSNETIARSGNFLHLTGVDTDLSSIVFFEKAKNSKLADDDYILTPNSDVMKKLAVMKEAMEFAHNAKMTGYFSPMSSGNLYTEVLVGNVRFSLGFVQDRITDGKYYVPNTLLNGDVKDFVGTAYPIEAIFEKSDSEDLYSHLVHISKKNQDKGILSLPLPKSIKKLIEPYIKAQQPQEQKDQEQQPSVQMKDDGAEKPRESADDALDLVAVTMDQCSNKIAQEMAQAAQAKNTQKEAAPQQVEQAQQARQVGQVQQVGQARQVGKGKQKTKSNNRSSGK